MLVGWVVFSDGGINRQTHTILFVYTSTCILFILDFLFRFFLLNGVQRINSEKYTVHATFKKL